MKSCRICDKEFLYEGKEVTCSPICKITMFLDCNNDDCWYIFNSVHVNAWIRYSSRVYHVRSFLYFKKFTKERLKICAKNPRCIKPDHQSRYWFNYPVITRFYYKFINLYSCMKNYIKGEN